MAPSRFCISCATDSHHVTIFAGLITQSAESVTQCDNDECLIDDYPMVLSEQHHEAVLSLTLQHRGTNIGLKQPLCVHTQSVFFPVGQFDSLIVYCWSMGEHVAADERSGLRGKAAVYILPSNKRSSLKVPWYTCFQVFISHTNSSGAVSHDEL